MRRGHSLGRSRTDCYTTKMSALRFLRLRAAFALLALSFLAHCSGCESADGPLGDAAQMGMDGGPGTGGAVTSSGGTTSSETGGASPTGGATSVDAGTGGVLASGGASASGGITSATGGVSGSGGADPACAAADSNGFFSDCSACLDPSDCDSVNGRQACGCSSVACPCGLSCGSFAIAPGINIGGICTR